MALQSKFRRPADSIATYDFFDIAGGTGYITFYGGRTITNNSTDWVLSTTPFYSYGTGTYESLTTSADTQEFAQDFDVVMNKTILIRGNVLVNTPCSIVSSGNNGRVYFKIYLRRVVGGTETTIGSSVSTSSKFNSSASTQHIVLHQTFNIANPEKVKKGDTLRLTIEAYSWVGSGTGSITVWHDPQGRTNDDITASESSNQAPTSDDSTILQMQLPILIGI